MPCSRLKAPSKGVVTVCSIILGEALGHLYCTVNCLVWWFGKNWIDNRGSRAKPIRLKVAKMIWMEKLERNRFFYSKIFLTNIRINRIVHIVNFCKWPMISVSYLILLIYRWCFLLLLILKKSTFYQRGLPKTLNRVGKYFNFYYEKVFSWRCYSILFSICNGVS